MAPEPVLKRKAGMTNFWLVGESPMTNVDSDTLLSIKQLEKDHTFSLKPPKTLVCSVTSPVVVNDFVLKRGVGVQRGGHEAFVNVDPLISRP